jgi:hypothetical protein
MKISVSNKILTLLYCTTLHVDGFSIIAAPGEKNLAKPLYSFDNYLDGLNDANDSGSVRGSQDSSLVGAEGNGNYGSLGSSATAEDIDYDIDEGIDMENIWDTVTAVKVQGGNSLRTWSTPTAQRVQVYMKSEGRPMSANIELWQGPDNTPQTMGIYIEDGNLRPFCAQIETPRGPNSVAVYNTGQLEFPFEVAVDTDMGTSPSAGLAAIKENLHEASTSKRIQGGALKTYPFAPGVASVQILLTTDGRPLTSRIELLQGPNNQKQVMDVYTEDGLERPFFVMIETPGSGNVVRILNMNPMEYPMNAHVEPYLVEEGFEGQPVLTMGGR